MRREEVRAAGDVAGSVLGGRVALVRDMHQSISDRVFRAVGPRRRVVRNIHDGVTQMVYGAVGEVHRWVPRIAATAGAMTVSREAPPLDATVRGNVALGALNSTDCGGTAWPPPTASCPSR
jgi:hypothetical protein